MPICHHLAPNGEKSLLYQALEQKYGPEKAHEAWEQVRSQEFLNRHGDWMQKDLFGSGRTRIALDENGEPTMKEVETRLRLNPFKPANKEQEEAITKVQDFIKNGNPKEFFTLEGKAGTGKTTLIQEALAPFIEEGKSVVIAALAHKAKLVLSNKLSERFGENATQSHTIASMLAMGMDMETGKFSPEFGAGTPPIQDADIIVVDESSMVNEEALSLIFEHKRPKAKVIFLGDIGQLPPIREGKIGAAADKESPTFSTKNKASLRERVRQGEESPILPYADLFWDNSQSEKPVENPAGEDARKTAVTEKGSLVFAHSKDLMPKLMPLYEEAVKTGNPDIVKTVVYKNSTRQIINKNIRDHIFGEDAKKQYVKGDLLMFTDNYALSARSKISNSSEVQVTTAKPSTTPDGWKIWNLDFAYDGKPVRVEALANEDAKRYKDHLDTLVAKAQAIPKGSPLRGPAWREFYAAKARFAPIDYGYAITSHKSQGSTYDYVAVGESDINSVQAISGKSKSQSIYTAITRARHAAFIMDGKHNDPYAIDLAIEMGKRNGEKKNAPVPPAEAEQPKKETKKKEPKKKDTPGPVPAQENGGLPPHPLQEKPIVTKQVGEKGKRTAESTTKVADQISAIYDEARKNPDKIYRIPYEYISDNHRFENNFSARELANLFDRDDIPENIQFAESFRRMIENSPRRIVAGFRSDIPVEFIGHERDQVLETAAKLMVPKLNARGEPDGFFTPGQQKDIVDSIVSFTERLYRRDPELGANAIIKAMGLFRSKQQQLTDMGDTDKATTFLSIYEQRRRLAEEALRQLEGLGLYTDEQTVNRILNAVEALRPMDAAEKAKFQEANPDIDPESVDIHSGEFLESIGRITRDWSENAFELDPKDTASAKIKMFFGTQYEMDKGSYVSRKDGEAISETEIPAQFDKMSQQQGIALAKKLNRKPFFYKDEATSKKLADWLSTNYPRIPKENFLGIGKTADYDRIFKDVLNTLGDKPQGTTFDEFMVMLDQHTDPTIQHMAQELRKQDQSMKNEFMTVMMKQYQPFVMALFNTARDASGREYYVLNPIESNRYGQERTLIDHWKQQQKLSEITVLSPSGERVLDTKRIRERWIPILKKAQAFNDWSTETARAWFVKNMGNILRLSGINVTDEMMGDFYANPQKYTQSQSVQALFGTNAAGEPTGAFSIFILKSAGQMRINEDVSNEDAVKLSQLHNPLYTENTFMRGMAKLVAKYTPVIYSNNHRNSENKSVWDWGMNTKLSHQFRSFIQGFDQFSQAIEKTEIGRNNYLLKILKENPVQIKDMELSYFDGLKPTWGKRGTTRQAMSDREQLLTSILLFQNHGGGFERKSKVHFMSLTHSDKTMTPVFKNMPHLNVGRYGVTPAHIIGSMDSALYNVFKAEYDRIINHESINSGSRQYEKGKGLFYFLPDFNYDGMKRLVDRGVITEAERQLIYPGGGRKLTKVIDEEKELPVINKVLKAFTENLIGNTLNKWMKNGIVSEDRFMFDRKYVQKLLFENGIKEQTKKGKLFGDPEAIEYVGADGKAIEYKDVVKMVAGNAAKDYAINHFLFNTSLSQLFYGDPAEAFKKSKEGNTDLDNVRSTMVEYAKRLAKDIAPRADLYWGEKTKYNQLTLADVNVTEKYLEDIQVLKKAYGEVNSTDAQELVTVQEKLDVLNAAGKIPSDVYGEMTKIIAEAKDGYYEFKDPRHLAIVMQPEKPIYSGMREPVNGIRLTDYIKSSAYALYPPLTRGREIDGLRRYMEKNNIQRADYESARKLGSPLEPLRAFTEDGRFIEPDPQKVQGAIRQLDRSGFGIQQEVPYDEAKEAIKTITQMNENIVEGIHEMNGFEMPGHGTMSGKELKALKESVRKKLITRNLDEFKRKFNIDENGNIDPERVFDTLVKEAQRDVRGSYTMNEIQSLMIRDTDGTPMIPLMFSTAAPKYEGLLMSMINRIAEVKMPGKSYVQVSSTGYRFQNADHADLSNVTWVEGYDGSPLKGMRMEDGKVKPGQVILPWNFFAPDGTKLKLEDFLVERDGKKYLDPIRVPKELLQLVGARIPNQKFSSIHPLEVVGFVPDNMGDMVLIPSALVKQMGGDFDVDKLYTYKRPYYYNEATKELFPQGQRFRERLGANAEEWNDLKRATKERLKAVGEEPSEEGFFEKEKFNQHLGEEVAARYPDGNVPKHRQLIKDAFEDEETLKNDYFNIHWAVLTHPEMLTKVLSPLDKNDLVEESAKLRPARADYYNYFDPQNQLEDFQSGKEAKRLVGSTSWAVKFSVRIQDKNLRFGKWENTGEGMAMVPDFLSVRDEHTGEIRQLGSLSGTGTSYYTKEDGGKVDEEAKRSKIDNHVMVQSESVDNAKNRTLDNLNLTPETYKAVQALIELQTSDGWAANSKYWTRLLTQPIIKEFSELMKQGNDSLSTSYDPQLLMSVYNKLIEKYKTEGPGEGSEGIVFDPQLLLKMQTMEGDEFIRHQRAALVFFYKLYDIGQRMFELESQFNQDVSGAGRDLFTVMDKDQKLRNINQVPILNSEELFSNGAELTEVGSTFMATNGTALSMVSQVLPYRSLQPIFSKVLEISGKPLLTLDQQRNILRGFRSYAYTMGQHFWNEAQGERVRLMYGKESLAKRVIEAQKNTDNPFLLRLAAKIGDAETAPDFVEYNAAGKATLIDRQNMTNGWLHLLLSENEGERKLGEDLLRYSFLTGGVQDANSFVEFAPAAYLAGTEMSGSLKDIERELRTSEAYENEGFLIQHIQHNPELAFQVKADLFGEQPKGREYPESFRVPEKDSEEYKKFVDLDQGEAGMRPFISYRSTGDGKWILFMKNQIGESTYYTRIDTLGNQYTDEYNGMAGGGQRSIFQENRSMADNLPGLDDMGALAELKNNMFGSFNNRVSYFDQVGVKEGGRTELNDAFNTIKADHSLPEYLRTTADFLLQTHESNEQVAAKSILGFNMSPLEVKWDKKMDAVGQSNYNNQIFLNPNAARSKTEAADTLLHESIHNRLQWMVVATGHEGRLQYTSEAQRKSYENRIAEYRKKFPETARHMDMLDKVRYEALNELRKQIGDDAFKRAENEALHGRDLSNRDARMYYALHSVQELVAHVMTDKETAEFLNEIKSGREGAPLLRKIWDIFQNLLVSFGKALGIKIKDESLLREALSHTMGLISLAERRPDITSAMLSGGELRTNSEMEAREIAKLSELTYARPAKVTGDEMGWNIEIKNEYKRRAVPGQRGKILDKLYEQRDDISEALNREKDLKKRVQLRVKYRDVREQIYELQQTNDINKIYQIGTKQLEWVDQVLKSPAPTTVDVNLALNTAHLWENLIDILYGDLQNVSEVSKDFVNLQTEAQKRRIELLNTKAIKVLADTFKGDMQLTPLDFKSKLEDIDVVSANTLSLTRAKPKLVQATAVLGWREANNRDEHIYRNTVRLQQLEKKMKDAGLTNTKLLDFDKESGQWGLVNRLDGSWYRYTQEQRTKLNTTLDALEKSEKMSDEDRAAKRKEAFNTYWNEMKKNAIFVDSRSFFDVKTGNKIQGELYDSAFKKLAQDVGSEGYARELIEKAGERYKTYLSEREAMSEWLDGNIELTAEEMKDKSKEEIQKLRDKKKAEAMTKWLQYNSPVDLLNRLDQGKNINFNSEGDQWIVTSPKDPGYYNQNYAEIQKNPKMLEAYNEYREILNEMISYLPMEVQAKLPDNFLPIVPKDTANFLAQMFGKIRNWDTEMLKALTATDAEEAGRLRPNKIPVQYTQPFGQTRELENRSTDAIRVLELFSMMALQHRYMGNVLDTINVAEGVLREVNQRRLAGMEDGKPLRNVIDALKYFKDALVFKKPKELQGKVESPVYSMNPAKQIKIEREVKSLMKEKEELKKKIEDKMTEGDFDSEVEDKRLEEIDKQLTEYEKQARNVYGSKVVDTLISINQMKALGYNPFSAVSNFTFAAVSVFINARGRTDFDPQTTREAWAVMTHSVKKYWMFNEMGDETAQKVHALMNRAGIMGDITDAAFGENTNLHSRKKGGKLRSAVQPFNWQKSGDYFTKGVLMVSMMKKKMVDYKDPATGETKQVSLWDAMDKEGKWNTEKYGENTDWYSDDVHMQTEWNRYRDRIRKTSMMVFGNQDKNSPLMAKKNWMLRLAAQFRLSWFPEGIATRWKDEYYDANMQRAIKGRWRTYKDLGIVNSGLVLAKQMLASLPGVKMNPFEGTTLRDGKPLATSEIDVENMRKNFSGLAWTVGLTAAILMLEAGAKQHKKDNKARKRQLLINMLIRNHQDLMLYSSPSVFNTISGNFLPATQVIVDYVNAMKASGHYFFGDHEKDKHAFEHWYRSIFRAGIPHPVFTLVNKSETMMTRDLDKLQR